MIDKAIAALILILAAVINLPMLLKFIWAAYQIKKQYKEEEQDG